MSKDVEDVVLSISDDLQEQWRNGNKRLVWVKLDTIPQPLAIAVVAHMLDGLDCQERSAFTDFVTMQL